MTWSDEASAAAARHASSSFAPVPTMSDGSLQQQKRETNDKQPLSETNAIILDEKSDDLDYSESASGGDGGPSSSRQTMCSSSSSNNNNNNTSGCMILLFGQALSFLLASGGAAQATLHLECNLSAPTFTSSIIYFILTFNLIPVYIKGRRLRRRAYISSNNDSGDQQPQPQEGRDGIIVASTAAAAAAAQTSGQDDENQEPRYYHYDWWCCGSLPLVASPWAYFGIAFLDVQANCMTVLAYRYTTITSVTLFDALAIPSAMCLSRAFLGRRYTSTHYCGVLSCMCGVVFNVWADYNQNEADSSSSTALSKSDQNMIYPHKVLGDVLAICGGILYGANDMLAEMAVRRFGGPCEFLGMLGLFGFLISVVQAALLERENIVQFFAARGISSSNACSVATSVGLLMVYALTNSLSYIGASRFLLVSEAAFLNLSFLTGDFWSLAFSIGAEKIVPNPLFFVALICTIAGVVVYETGPRAVISDDSTKYESIVRGETELTDNSVA